MPSAPGWWGSEAGLKGRALDDPLAIRQAGPELLSLALIDARNQLLRSLAHDESPPALRLALRAGAYQEYWIARHVQRARGEACEAGAPRLAGIEPRIEAWITGRGEAPTPAAVRSFLAETMELTLDLLAATPQADAPLHFFRLGLLHDDRLGEALAERLRMGAPAARVGRAPIGLPAQRWQLGSPPGGLVPDNERWAHEVPVAEFEIDAQPVNWAQYVEFAADGGYERRELWSESGWAWAQATARRAPGGVAQWRGAVIVQRGPAALAGLQRAPAGQPVMHVSRFEAEAWCRWAGRRLPSEPEWELAAACATGLGYAWGEVFEWVAGSARAWPGGGVATPGTLDTPVAPGTRGVLRGASFATRLRWHHPKARRFAPPGSDAAFCGFRSCAV
jgi:formylglycine-generating enzyme required for sulfatase activity